MGRIKYYIEKYKILIILIVILFVLLFSLLYPLIKKDNNNEIETIKIESQENEEDKEDRKENVIVDIKGYVKNPGTYNAPTTSRVIDVINLAGGLIDGANTEYINLSKKIVDEMVIIIYSNDEISKFKETEKEIVYLEYECKCPDNENDACITEDDVVNTNGNKTNSSSSLNTPTTTDKISINTATLDELMTLSGIGESKAKAIIEYREKNNGFKSLEEIINVSGIGEKVYSKIKDYIKL